MLATLLIIIEGCIGAQGDVCNGKNFSLRVGYPTMEACQVAKKNIKAPGGFEKFVSVACMEGPPK